MQQIVTHLRDLLFMHDCVTIPGLGGFIMHAQPARIDRERGRLFPPARLATFNSKLSHDDGLLTSAIAHEEKLEYGLASEMVTRFVQDTRRQLSEGMPVMLEGIGELYEGYEGNLRFLPKHGASLSSDYFGLEPVTARPLRPSRPQTRGMTRHEDRKTPVFMERQPASVRWTVALTLPVILFLLYGILFPVSMQPIITGVAGLFQDAPSLILRQDYSAEPSVPENLAPAPSEMIVISAEEPEQVPLHPSEVKITDPVPSISQPVASGPRFYIIGGCFEQVQNAEKFREQLARQGYPSEEAGVNRLGQIRVSYHSFSERAAALEYLEEIRNNVNPSAWLLKY